MIRASDRVASVLASDERLLEVFVSASPAFAMLRNTAARRTMARLVTIEQAAKIAGIEAAVLLDRLNGAFGGHAPPVAATAPAAHAEAHANAPAHADARAPEPAEIAPDGLLATPPDRLVDVDVRDELRAGREPLRQILDAVKTLPAGKVLRVRAIFEPAPLYAVLGRQGLAHFTERLAADDWRVWFFRDPSANASANASASANRASGVAMSPADAARDLHDLEEDVIVLDVRDLEPPEPMVRTLEALAVLPRGKTLVQLNARVPQFLLPKLAERGFSYEIREQSADLVRLFIRHA